MSQSVENWLQNLSPFSSKRIMGTSTSLLLILLLPSSFCQVHLFLRLATAAVSTDPQEADALSTMFQRWGITSLMTWNTSADPCSGAALNSTSFDLDKYYNAMITCQCNNISSTAGNTTCHITQLKVHKQNVTGPIPQELLSFKHLQTVDFGANYLTGPIPTFFENFTNLQYLSLFMNALSGPIPKELGNIKTLTFLDFGINNFSGTIPPELGGLINLEYLYMDSSRLSGEFPFALSNLTNLKEIWAHDLSFTGKVPDFLGNLTNLQVLKLHGNSLEGPIPASFSNLVSMINLIIGDIVIGAESSTLQFISNMSSIKALIVRNCKISGELPSDFSKYRSLQQLDLSFNSFTGSIPQSLFSLAPLKFLFLGNNSLSGSLPTQKSSNLTIVDLSYNQLSGNFPTWIGESNLTLNLVANNFAIDDGSNSSGLPAGLRCLQNDKPCYRNPPIYSSFAVKCCGNKTTSASEDGQYEIDNANLSSASYYVSNPIKWGVSSVGIWVDNSGVIPTSSRSSSYKINSVQQFQGAQDSEISIENSRSSPSSLRYYGIGLENGDYVVKLHYIETQFMDGRTWKSLGRRMFDVYIQGDLKEKDFDIRKEAGGISFIAVEKEYNTSVTNNFLDIHFFWAGKGTMNIPFDGYYGPSVSAISVSLRSGSSSSSHTGLAVGLAVGVAVVALAIVSIIVLWIRRKRIPKEDYERVLLGMDVKPDIFSYAEMTAATDNFGSSNILGEGGYGPVFKGKLSDGRTVAVKQLSVASHQGKHHFLTEIATISAVQHRNLVKLHGCCVEGDKRILVYEFLQNKSLDKAIFGNSTLHIDWPKRFEICLGVPRGLAYLHEESSIRIVHRDVKASNILLDADLNPKISDFGLAKLYDESKTHVTTKVAGTIGYVAPEYAMRGHLTEKADVYAFGVLSLEIIAGRPNLNQRLGTEKVYLLEWAWQLHENRRELELVDGSLSSFDEDEAARVIGVALLCTQASYAQRPPMSRVVAMLAGDVEVPEVTSKPSYLADWRNSNDSNNHASGSTMSTHSAATSLMNSFVQEGR